MEAAHDQCFSRKWEVGLTWRDGYYSCEAKEVHWLGYREVEFRAYDVLFKKWIKDNGIDIAWSEVEIEEG